MGFVRRRWISFLNCSTDKKYRRQNAVGIFAGLPSPRLRGHYFNLVCRREGQNAGARLIPQRVLSCGDATRLRAKSLRQNCFAPANNADGKTPSVFFAGLPSPRLRGLNLFACYIYWKESARRRAANTAEGIDPARAAQIHPEIACSKLLRTGKQHRRQNAVGIFCRLALTPLARSIFGLG